MAEPDIQQQTEPDDDHGERADYSARIRLGIWLLVSVLFVGYLLVGSVEIRLWQSGQMTFVDREITHVWTYFGDRLPDLPSPALTTFIFWLSVFMMVATTVAGLWYFLVPRGSDDQDAAEPGRSHIASLHE